MFPVLCATGEGMLTDMTHEQRDTHVDELREEWNGLLSNVDLWVSALKNPEADGDITRQEIRDQTILGKPIGQLALVGGYALRLQQGDEIDRKMLYRKINAIDWGVDNKKMWEHVLMNPTGRVMSGKTTMSNASKFIAYLLGAKLTRIEAKELAVRIYGEPNAKLPKPVASIRKS